MLLDILVDQAVKAIKSAYRLEYTPPSAREQRELSVGVRMASGDARSRLVSYRADPAPSVPQPLLFLGIGLPLLALAGGGLYYYWLRPVKTDYYLAGYGPSTGHVPELYLYTDWRPLGRGGRGYPLTPDDPFFAGISKTHVWLRVQNWRRIQGGSGQAQGVGAVEARAGRPSSGVGLNTTFVHNELTGLRALSEKPFRLQTGDVLILQSAAHTGEGLNGMPDGVYLRLGYVGGTVVEQRQAAPAGAPDGAPFDPDKTVVEGEVDPNRTVVEQDTGVDTGAPARVERAQRATREGVNTGATAVPGAFPPPPRPPASPGPAGPRG